MSEIDRTGMEESALAGRVDDRASSFICTYSVDKLAWRSKITTEQSIAILRAAGMAGLPNDRG